MGMNFRTDKFTLVNGIVKIIVRRATEFRYGQMDQNMRDFGKIIRLLASEDLF
jgi:hypothetical protein